MSVPRRNVTSRSMHALDALPESQNGDPSCSQVYRRRQSDCAWVSCPMLALSPQALGDLLSKTSFRKPRLPRGLPTESRCSAGTGFDNRRAASSEFSVMALRSPCYSATVQLALQE